MSSSTKGLSGKNSKDDAPSDGPSSSSVNAGRRGRSRSPFRKATKKGKSVLGIITGESRRKKKRAKDAKEAALAVVKASSEDAKAQEDAQASSAHNSSPPDLDDDETVYGVDFDSAAAPSKPTSPATTPVKDKTDSSTLSRSSSGEHIPVILLLMDPKTRRFEVLQLEFDSHKTVVNDILEQIPHAATEETLRLQKYHGICDRHGSEMINSKPLSDYCKGGEVFLAVAKDLTNNECAKLAKPILNDPCVIAMLGPSVDTDDDLALVDKKDPAPKAQDVKTSASDNATEQVAKTVSFSASKPDSSVASKTDSSIASKTDSSSASKPESLSILKPGLTSAPKSDKFSEPKSDLAPAPETQLISASKPDSQPASKQTSKRVTRSEPELVPESVSQPVTDKVDKIPEVLDKISSTERLSTIEEDSSEPKKSKKKSSILKIFMIFFLLLLAAVPLLMKFQKNITAPLEPGDVLAPGEWRSKCGLLGFFPKSYTGCDQKAIGMGRDGVMTLYHKRKPTVTLTGAVCKEGDKKCVPGAEFGKNGIIKIGGVPAKLAGEGSYSMIPWPIADSSFVQEETKKKRRGFFDWILRLFPIPKLGKASKK